MPGRDDALKPRVVALHSNRKGIFVGHLTLAGQALDQ
jgi:hypothetical protein